jgi:hypothetical protein
MTNKLPAAQIYCTAAQSAAQFPPMNSLQALCIAVLLHHSFAMFDTAKSMTLTGTVTTFQWTNPHAYIEIDVPEGATSKHWSIELGSPSILMQSGWKFKDLKHGDKITVQISPLKSGETGGLLIQATLPDGRTLGNGPGRGPAQPAGDKK